MKLAMAEAIAQELLGYFAPVCDRIEIAGSVRRQKKEVKDIEIVYIPSVGHRAVDLFGTEEPYRLPDVTLRNLERMDILVPDQRVKRWGDKYKRAVHVASGMVVEMFAADADNWGYILALRTGPADFNKLLVTPQVYGGALPFGRRVNGGYVWGSREIVPVPEEEQFFAEVGVPCWPPEERSKAKLALYLHERGRR